MHVNSSEAANDARATSRISCISLLPLCDRAVLVAGWFVASAAVSTTPWLRAAGATQLMHPQCLLVSIAAAVLLLTAVAQGHITLLPPEASMTPSRPSMMFS
jgi:hypothetical protein